jgi:hypothetical protein
VLVIGQKVRGFHSGRGHGSVREIKYRSTNSFEGKVKPSVPCRNILHVKDPYSYEKDTCRQNLRAFLAKYLPASLLVASVGICQIALVDESEMVRTQMGRTRDHKMVAVYGALCMIPSRDSNQYGLAFSF